MPIGDFPQMVVTWSADRVLHRKSSCGGEPLAEGLQQPEANEYGPQREAIDCPMEGLRTPTR
jgi:hypothetical protein